MKITIEMNLDNAAFNNDGDLDGKEVSRILGKIGTAVDGARISFLDEYGDEGRLFDYNGNKVGGWEIV